MVKLCDWVKKVKERDGKCKECSSVEGLKVIREGDGITLCKAHYFKYHNDRKVPGKRKERPLTPTSKKDRLWAEIERLRSLTTPETHGQEMRNLQEASK